LAEAQREYRKVNDKLLQRISDMKKGVPTGSVNSRRQWIVPAALLAGRLGLAICAQIAAYADQKETARLWLSKITQEDAATEEELRRALEH
jgi:hypothetical protein